MKDDTTKPDVVVPRSGPYPFDDNYFDAAYMGHVLEHLPWDDVAPFIQDILRTVKPGAPVLIAGPDSTKAIQLYRMGEIPWALVETILEHQHFNFQESRQNIDWDGASHFWNCSAERICLLLSSLGIKRYQDVTNEMSQYPYVNGWYDTSNGIIWPIVAKVNWQFGVLFINNK
jgi:SAM-dependent methyltransferase